MSYYSTKASPKLDMFRHRRDEAIIREKIKELEEQTVRDHFEDTVLEVYREFLNRLLESKARLVERIGRK